VRENGGWGGVGFSDLIYLFIYFYNFSETGHYISFSHIYREDNACVMKG
jgi:hypothetical protein